MPPPRTPNDDELRAYVESRPPSARLSSAHERVAARLDTATGIHDLEELRREMQERAISAMREKIDDEHEARLKAEDDARQARAQVDKIHEDRRKFWGGILAAVLTAVILAVLGFAAVRLLAIQPPSETPLVTPRTKEPAHP